MDKSTYLTGLLGRLNEEDYYAWFTVSVSAIIVKIRKERQNSSVLDLQPEFFLGVLCFLLKLTSVFLPTPLFQHYSFAD